MDIDIDLTCPHCHQLDLVQSVPTLHAEGVSTSSGTDIYSGVGVASTGLVPVIGTATVERTRTTALARSLAREPAQLPTGGATLFGLLLLFPALFVAVIGIVSLPTSTDPATRSLVGLAGATFFVALIASPGLLVLCVAVSRARRNGRISRGRSNAHVVWQAGFYCHRCGVAFWPRYPAPGIPARVAFPPEHFRWMVWNAGGYTDA
ncbi:hypothetical protein [Nocardia gipuzkoensis]